MCSGEQEEGCENCPIREECILWFSNVPACTPLGKKCNDYVLQAIVLRAKKRRLVSEKQNGTGHK